jgi:hypothetical protein
MDAQAEQVAQTLNGPPISIITCPQWGARPPLSAIVPCGKASRIIFHHTAGHHPEIALPNDESRAESIRYALDIQYAHTHPSRTDPSKPWKDSGHNLLICRNGLVLQGRWGTVSQIQAGRMVVSAHCPGFNTQIGIEHEHQGDEPMTDEQWESSALTQAWIAWLYKRKTVLPVDPHSAHFATSCPANLKAGIPAIRERAQQILADV